MWGTWWILESSSEATWLCAITALLCVLAASLMTLTTLKGSSKLPPGPLALPIIGHMHLLGAHPARSLARMSHRYGPLISLKLGSIPFIVASTPEAARQILQTCDQMFAFRAHLSSVDAIYGVCRGITFSEPGPYLRFLRQLCATDLFNARPLEGFKPIRDEEVSMLLRSVLGDGTIPWESADHSVRDGNTNTNVLDEESNKLQTMTYRSQASPIFACRLVDLRPKLQTTTNNIISRMVVGEASSTVLPPILEAIEALSAVNLGDFFPSIQWADLQGCVKRSKKAGIKMHAALQGIIEKRRKQRAGVFDMQADILDILLSASLTSPQDLQITDAHIRAALLDIFGGGTDTSAVVLEWTMAELLANPTKMKVVEEEVQRVVSQKEGNKHMVEESDIQNMPYLKAVVKESMRLHPVLPLLVPRESREACKIFGFDIPAKTQAFVNVWAIGRDPNVWENPNEFQPERFLDSNIDVRGQHFELLPFGSGRRVCPGQNLGLLNVHIILASLLYAFSWSPHDHEHDMAEKFGYITTKAIPLLARATKRIL